MRPLALLTLCFLTASSLCAQQPSPWQGEWSPLDASGDRLTLGDCTAQSCKFYLAHKGCSTLTNSPLSVQSDTEATANLPGEDATHSCQLHLQRSASNKPTIAVKQSGNGCSYYCISGYGSFETTFVQHSSVVYAGRHAAECLKTTTPAPMATCLDPALAGLEQQWQDLYSDFPLTPPKKDTTAYQASEAARRRHPRRVRQGHRSSPMSPVSLHLRHRCDERKEGRIHRRLHRTRRPNRGRPHRSLHRRPLSPYLRQRRRAGRQLPHHRQAHHHPGRHRLHPLRRLSQLLQRPHLLALRRRALPQGRQFRLRRRPRQRRLRPPAPSASSPSSPTPRAVEFKDLTGGCKDYCGARGSWNGEAFSFRDRLPPKAATKPSPK